jgi:transketolase
VREGDDITLVGARVTLHEALRPPEELAGDGGAARGFDRYSGKPLDAQTLARAAAETGAIVTVEDHWPEGGLGEAVLSALAEAGQSCPVRKLGVEIMPGSGTPEELLREAGIDAGAIATAARELVGARATA